MNWIDVKDKLPDCDYQHDKIYASGFVLTVDIYGDYEINQYAKYYKHTSDGLVLEKEGWNEMDGEITHWIKLTQPKIK